MREKNVFIILLIKSQLFSLKTTVFALLSLIEHDNFPENERPVYNSYCTSDANVNASTVRYACAVSCIITLLS